MFAKAPEGYKIVRVRFLDTPAQASLMSTLEPGFSFSRGFKYDDKQLYSVHQSSGLYITAANKEIAEAHASAMRVASGQAAELWNPIPACIVGGYTPSAVKALWMRLYGNNGGAVDAAIENAYCSLMYSLTKFPKEAVFLDVAIPEYASIPNDVYTASGLAAALKF